MIADCLCDTESAGGFVQALLSSKDQVWPCIDRELERNLTTLEIEKDKKINFFASPEYDLNFLQDPQCGVEQNDKPKVMRQLKSKTHPSQDALEKGFKAAADALAQAQVEYEKMVQLHLDSVSGKSCVKRHTEEEDDEQFGDGHGVRKDTYLDRLPGKRRLRVAEIRDTSHLARLQDQL